MPGMQPSRSGYKIGLRVASNERKSSIGPDPNQADGLSPYPSIQKQLQITKEKSYSRVD